MNIVAVILTVVLANTWVAGYPSSEGLYEGFDCPLEDGGIGVCKKLPDCPYRVLEVQGGRRTFESPGRCGFDNFTEIVCCPLNITGKIGLRPAEAACRQYENEVVTTEVTFHIYGGVEAQQGEFPYMVALGYRNNEPDDNGVVQPIRYRCGGTLISSQYVLTAAHCVTNHLDSVPVEVRVGNSDLTLDDNVQRIGISKIIAHPRYKRSVFYNDVAILKLKTSVRKTAMVKPICLQTRTLETMHPSANISFIVIGWGATDLSNDGTTKLMKAPTMRLVETATCSDRFKDFRQLPNGIDDTMVCAVDTNLTRGADACFGDSGGPLLMISQFGHSVIGVSSFGQGCGGPIPGIYTSVYSYLDWIEEKVWPEDTMAPEREEGDPGFSIKLTFKTS